MSSKNSHIRPPADSRTKPDAPDRSAGVSALTQAASAWTSLVDGWWQQQAATLPPELQRALTSTLDQSKALVDMACAQAASAVAGAPAGAHEGELPSGAGPHAAGDYGLWQPIIDACRACESSLVGSASESGQPGPGKAQEYQRAANAYLNEFAQINLDIIARLQRKFAAGPPADFRQLHALVVETAEDAYLDRVSGDRFAARQAEFINALFKLRRGLTETTPAGGT